MRMLFTVRLGEADRLDTQGYCFKSILHDFNPIFKKLTLSTASKKVTPTPVVFTNKSCCF